MAILATRVVKMELGIERSKWDYQRLQQEQRQRALLIVPFFVTFFEQQRTNNPELIKPINDNWEIREIDFYNIAYNDNNQTFLLSRINEQLNLIKYNRSNDEIEIARGLTEGDIAFWART